LCVVCIDSNMGCCCCKHATSDLDDVINDQDEPKGGWHDDMTLKEKKKLAESHQAHECFIFKCCGIFGAWSGLKCCCCAFNADQPLLSIKESRHCTDVPCCILFIIALLAQGFLVYNAINEEQADPRSLLYYTDYQGQICGPDFPFELDVDLDFLSQIYNASYGDLNLDFFDDNNTAGNFAAWPDLRMYDVRVCVSHCNDTVDDPRIVTPSFDTDLNADDILAADVSGYSSVNIFDIVCVPDPSSITDIVSADMININDEFTKAFDNLNEAINQGFSNIMVCWNILFPMCAALALFISMTWGCLIRWCGSIIIWTSIITTIMAAAVMAYGMVEYSQSAYDFGYATVGDIMYYGGYVVGILVGMFALAIIFMWNRIRLAIALSKETTRALTDAMGLFFYPVFPFFFFLGYLGYWVVGACYMYSVNEEVETPFPAGYTIPYYVGGPTLQTKLGLPEEDAVYISLETQETWQYLTLAHFFMLLWVKTFIDYHTYMVIAGVYAEWYFADWKDKNETHKWRGSDEKVLVVEDQVVRTETQLDKAKDRFSEKLHAAINEEFNNEQVRAEMGRVSMKEELKRINKFSKWPVCNSLWRVTFNHMGTIAFASLLIAIVDFVEKTLTYFEKKFRNGEPSPVQKAVLAAIKCILRCVKCILNRINKNGLIICSIYGWPFCASSMKGIIVVMKNVIRASALTLVSGYLEKLGKIAIVCLNMAICMAFAATYWEGEMTSLIFPGVICALITVAICWHYMNLYEVGLSAIFICFLIDEERNKKSHEMKASHRLRNIIGATKPHKRYLMEKAQSIRAEGLMDEEQREHFSQEHLTDADHDVIHRNISVHLDSKHGPETSRTMSVDSDGDPDHAVITPPADGASNSIQMTMQKKMGQ